MTKEQRLVLEAMKVIFSPDGLEFDHRSDNTVSVGVIGYDRRFVLEPDGVLRYGEERYRA